jgi:lysophospholipase L1-like esterase
MSCQEEALSAEETVRSADSYWEPEIRAFEEEDRSHLPKPGQVLFVGSSSIGLWPDLEREFADLPAFRRGFGGSTVADLLHYMDRIVLPYRPRAIVVYSGDNDIAGGKTPAAVCDELAQFFARVRAVLPEIPIYVFAVKPSPSRRRLWDQFIQLNVLLRTLADRTPSVTFLDVWPPMLAPDGSGRPELFTPDLLHMNRAGYAIWSAMLRKSMTRDGK